MEFFYGRIFTVYGEGQFSGNLWPSLRQTAIAGNDFPMTDGENIRDFLPVADVARHLRTAAERRDIQSDQPLVVNIGSGYGLRVVDFAQQQWRILVPLALFSWCYSRSRTRWRCVADIKYLNLDINKEYL